MPQHEVANGNGQIEFFLASPITLSNRVAKNPGPSWPSDFSPTLILVAIASIVLVLPLQRTLLQQIEKADQQKSDKQNHFDKPWNCQLFEIHCPGIHEYH